MVAARRKIGFGNCIFLLFSRPVPTGVMWCGPYGGCLVFRAEKTSDLGDDKSNERGLIGLGYWYDGSSIS